MFETMDRRQLLNEVAQDAVKKALDRLEEEILQQTGQASGEDLDLINQFRPLGLPPYQEGEMLSVEIRASHNLIWADRQAWTINVLEQFAQDYPGKAYILDHDSWDSDRVIGFVYKAELRRSSTAPEKILDNRGFGDLNREIVERDGFVELILYTAVQRGTPIEQNIRYRRYSQVSTGGWVWSQNICPLCNVEFEEEACPHIPPTPWTMWLASEGYLDGDELALIAPYIIKDADLVDVVELSQVVAGNLGTAEILDERSRTQSA